MIENKIAHIVVNGFESIFGSQVQAEQLQFQKTRKDFSGDITLVVFPLLKLSKTNPVETGNKIGELLKDNCDDVAGYNVVQGFLNIELTDDYWIETLQNISSTDDFGFKSNSGKTYMVEYSSPNTNKPLHLGHLRNIFLGHSVAEIFKANGHKVIKTQIINDRGIHICKSMIAWQKVGNGETPESADVKGDKLVGKYYVIFDQLFKAEIKAMVEAGSTQEEAEKKAPIILEAQEMLKKWEVGDSEVVSLWKMMNSWVYDGFDATYKTMDVVFDKLYYESDTYLLGKENIEAGLLSGVFFKKDDGSVWCDLTEDGLDEKLVLRSDGTAVYMTQDIGTATERFKDFPDLNGITYTVGNEQDYHFKVLFLILKKLGFPWASECYHLSYGMVDLPTGKMKSREGTVVDADELMAEMIASAKQSTEELGKLDGLSEDEKSSISYKIGMGALKYFLLKVDPKKRMMFNPEESIDFQGNTGPFVQYAFARISSILRKADEIDKSAFPSEVRTQELELIKVISEFPSIVEEAGANHSPALVANYAYDLVKTFNQFYQTVTILKEADQTKLNFRLHLTELTGEVIKKSMHLLGIQVPNRM